MTEIKHEEHDVEIKWSTNNTKHQRVTTLTIRKDIATLDEVKEIAKQMKEVWDELEK